MRICAQPHKIYAQFGTDRMDRTRTHNPSVWNPAVGAKIAFLCCCAIKPQLYPSQGDLLISDWLCYLQVVNRIDHEWLQETF